MKITLMCNAGLMIQVQESSILIDLPNKYCDPYYALTDEIWGKIKSKEYPYNTVRGFFFTHNHSDHFDKDRFSGYELDEQFYFMPSAQTQHGCISLEEWQIEYQRIAHAPIENAPPHVVAYITAEDKSVYIAGDAALECEAHKLFLNGRKADVAFWNAMYMSRAETRKLMAETAEKNFIYHMPSGEDQFGIWAKCRKNLQRYPNELNKVTVINEYPHSWVL